MGHQRREQDHYGHRAKKEKYAARSVYKLSEINDRFKILQPGQRVLDLGCYPGSWLQFASEVVGKRGVLTGVDLQTPKIELPHQVRVIVGDVLELSPKEILLEIGPVDVVLSDMAPSTSGVRIVDQLRAHLLSQAAWFWSKALLAEDGCLVVKIFQGPDTPELIKEIRTGFKKVRTFKPKGSRKESMETYVIAQGRTPEADEDEEEMGG